MLIVSIVLLCLCVVLLIGFNLQRLLITEVDQKVVKLMIRPQFYIYIYIAFNLSLICICFLIFMS